MKRYIIIISLLALLPLVVQAQHYGFYGRGRSYSKGYVGYHPEGISHSRNAYFEGPKSRRSGSSLPTLNARREAGGFERAEVNGTYNHVNVRSGSHRSSGNPSISRGSRVDLGLSTKVGHDGGRYSGNGGSTSSGVFYGRMGGGSSSGNVSYTGSVMSKAPSASAILSLGESFLAPPDFDSGSSSGQGFMEPTDFDTGTSSGQGFMEAPDFDSAPLGDAIVPLVLLLLPIVIVKSRRMFSH